MRMRNCEFRWPVAIEWPESVTLRRELPDGDEKRRYVPEEELGAEHALVVTLEQSDERLREENAKLRELVETYGMIANDRVLDYFERDEMLETANATARELGVME